MFILRPLHSRKQRFSLCPIVGGEIHGRLHQIELQTSTVDGFHPKEKSKSITHTSFTAESIWSGMISNWRRWHDTWWRLYQGFGDRRVRKNELPHMSVTAKRSKLFSGPIYSQSRSFGHCCLTRNDDYTQHVTSWAHAHKRPIHVMNDAWMLQALCGVNPSLMPPPGTSSSSSSVYHLAGYRACCCLIASVKRHRCSTTTPAALH